MSQSFPIPNPVGPSLLYHCKSGVGKGRAWHIISHTYCSCTVAELGSPDGKRIYTTSSAPTCIPRFPLSNSRHIPLPSFMAQPIPPGACASPGSFPRRHTGLGSNGTTPAQQQSIMEKQAIIFGRQIAESISTTSGDL